MPQINIDVHSLEILKDCKDKLKKKGMNARYSDAIRELGRGD